MENVLLRLATLNDLDDIMVFINEAKVFMASQNSGQWQDQHPRRETIKTDIENSHYYVIEIDGHAIAGMGLLPYDPDYETLLEGHWISQGPYMVIHRMAVSTRYHGRGLAALLLQQAELIAKQHRAISIRLDTHQRNTPMVGLLKKKGYIHIGAVLLHNFKRRVAFEKII